jgi:poly(A) polymerase
MEKALQIQKQVQTILGTDEVYLVGGSVRDLVMGNEPKDYDFTTPLLPDEVESKIAAAGRHVYAIGKKFGTIGFKVPIVELEEISDMGSAGFEFEGKPIHNFEIGTKTKYLYIEVTTFRSEVYTSKSRKPSLDEDLSRRDFTMNAMVLKGDGKIYDPFGGRLDIHAKQIKTVGKPKDRIQEDPLRMLRAARFAARYDFKIDPNFIGKARQLADRIYDVSVERWVHELDKLLTCTYVWQGLAAIDKMGLWERILPELNDYAEYAGPDKKVYVSADMAWHDLLRKVNYDPKIANYMNSGICYRLKFSNDRTKIVLDK